jgi:threonine/homoserine/homoserine lactone efflux protein
VEHETLDILTLAGLAAGSFVLALSGALAPGPTFFVTIAGSRRRGFWFGPLVVLGHALAELPVVALLLWWASTVLGNPYVLAAIGGVGAAALVWMGIGMVRQARRPPEELPEPAAGGPAPTPPAGGRYRIFIEAVPAGFLTSIGNPYWHLWWVTCPTYLLASAAAQGWPGVAAFFIGHIAADLAWLSATSLAVSSGRRLLAGRLYTGLLVCCAVVLFVMAGFFLKLAVESAFGWTLPRVV